ncbi:PEP-CTERM sorting domain-containing protein [Nitrosomonas sp.]|uniref:PEP-CTERM sorting domain-containing protein n=1 Tax=Nitrosomonas sp. TaxID=42353 RepID=UPI001DF52C72|nr:PEP-CTERM sorting domain-containing protein [Nitrosomonas sp.]MBX3616914.1 PEP-CTERM sorting domain-containing protein [Nitrosomonas sp.]
MTRILIIALLLISPNVSAFSVEWLPLVTTEKNGNPLSIYGNPVLEYRNAGKGGIDWVVTGDGPTGGRGIRELWLFDDSAAGIPGTSQATTTFSAISNAVGFVMAGDHNDGFAQFLVDNVDIGTFDMYRAGNRILVVTGLDFMTHTLTIVQLGEHNLNSTKGDVAIFGGAAFNTSIAAIPEPQTYAMLLVGLMLLVSMARYQKQYI